MTDTSEKRLNVTGLLCPIPVLRVRRALDSLKAGERLIVTASDPATIHDMPAFCIMAGHKMIMAREKGSEIIFEIEKAKD
jgi:tRNA 2-thiouridine synthesizing protein A